MSSLNKAILIGNLGGDPELTHTATGRAKLSFSMATNESWKDDEGEWQVRTDWHRVVLWGPGAVRRHEVLKKGLQVCVEGSIRQRSYEKDGSTRTITEVNAWKVMPLGLKAKSSESEPAAVPF